MKIYNCDDGIKVDEATIYMCDEGEFTFDDGAMFITNLVVVIIVGEEIYKFLTSRIKMIEYLTENGEDEGSIWFGGDKNSR